MASTIRLRVVGELNKFTAQKVRELILGITANLVEDTPVDTGWARANWVPSIGRPFSDYASPKEQVNDQLQAQGIAQVATSYELDQGPAFISNNVPYIVALNNGHSKQAPSGFVEAAVLRAVKDVA